MLRCCHHRSQLYYYLYCTYLVTQLIGPYIASKLMGVSAYLPLGLSIACLASGVVTVLFIDESTGSEPSFKPSSDSLLSATPEQQFAPADLISETNSESEFIAKTATARELHALLRSWNVLATLSLFIFPAFRPTTTHVLLPYMSVRFGWKLSKATILISEVAIVNIIVFLLILPQSTPWIKRRFGISAEALDLGITRSSLLLLMTGAVLLAFAPNVAAIVFGMCSKVCLRHADGPFNLLR